MGYRLSKIYTRTGDDGYTSLGDGNRILKNTSRLALLGTLDELNSHLGLVLAYQPITTSIVDCLFNAQQDLFNLSGELCPPYHQVISAEKITILENTIDDWNATLPPLTEFILPGGNLVTASCHIARTVCRRAERSAVTLYKKEPFNPEILRYLNRLSDVLFVAARLLARETGSKEVMWEHVRK
jgi:cob(I)alamin adenosyltransferase